MHTYYICVGLMGTLSTWERKDSNHKGVACCSLGWIYHPSNIVHDLLFHMLRTPVHSFLSPIQMTEGVK